MDMAENEYLEKALEENRQISEVAEHKNRIRRLFKQFFKERECKVLVRPVEQESDIQNLDTLEDY